MMIVTYESKGIEYKEVLMRGSVPAMVQYLIEKHNDQDIIIRRIEGENHERED